MVIVELRNFAMTWLIFTAHNNILRLLLKSQYFELADSDFDSIDIDSINSSLLKHVKA